MDNSLYLAPGDAYKYDNQILLEETRREFNKKLPLLKDIYPQYFEVLNGTSSPVLVSVCTSLKDLKNFENTIEELELEYLRIEPNCYLIFVDTTDYSAVALVPKSKGECLVKYFGLDDISELESYSEDYEEEEDASKHCNSDKRGFDFKGKVKDTKEAFEFLNKLPDGYTVDDFLDDLEKKNYTGSFIDALKDICK